MNCSRQWAFRASVHHRAAAQVHEVVAKSFSLRNLNGTAPHLPHTCPACPSVDPGGFTIHIGIKARLHTHTRTHMHSRIGTHPHIPSCTPYSMSTVPRQVRRDAEVISHPDLSGTTQVLPFKTALNPKTSQSWEDHTR